MENNIENNKVNLETYEALMKELDNSLRIVQDKNSNLADVIKAYDDGVKAHKKCVELLNLMEQRVIDITNKKESF